LVPLRWQLALLWPPSTRWDQSSTRGSGVERLLAQEFTAGQPDLEHHPGGTLLYSHENRRSGRLHRLSPGRRSPICLRRDARGVVATCADRRLGARPPPLVEERLEVKRLPEGDAL
jgi:hypothetical protein